MKSGKSLFRLPFVSRKWHEARANYLWELIEERGRVCEKLQEEIKSINLKRNAKGQFERRAK